MGILAIIILISLISPLDRRLVLRCDLSGSDQERVLNACPLADRGLATLAPMAMAWIYRTQQVLMEGQHIGFAVFLLFCFDRVSILCVYFFSVVLLSLHHELLDFILFLLKLSRSDSLA